MRIAIVDCRIAAEVETSLGGYVDKIIKLPAYNRLAAPVASHPDMLLWSRGDIIVTYRDYYDVAREQLRELEQMGYKTVFCDEIASEQYPSDVALNCALLGKHVIANTRHVSEKIRKIAASGGLRLLHTNQGYAKCSTVCVSDNALITSDASIYKCAAQNGISALRVRPDHVRLDGYGTGFLGGASGTTESEVLFCGNLDLHPDADSIRAFCAEHKRCAVSLGGGALYDYGTIMILSEI